MKDVNNIILIYFTTIVSEHDILKIFSFKIEYIVKPFFERNKFIEKVKINDIYSIRI